MDDHGARRLIAAILKQAYEDYAEDKTCLTGVNTKTIASNRR
jgi:hypothetical protein